MEAATMEARDKSGRKPNWRQVGTFVGLVFLLSYLLDLGLYLSVGYGTHPATTVLLQLQMLIPAAVAIVLQLWVFRDSAIYRTKAPPRWFFYLFLVYTLLYVALGAGAVFISSEIFYIAASLITLGLSVVLLLIAVVLRLVAGREAFARAGLGGGKIRYYLLFGLSLVVIYGAMTGLNALFGLGQAVDVKEVLLEAAGAQSEALEAVPSSLLLLVSAVQSLLLAPLLSIIIAFGEEYGWRGYLQGELIHLGKVRGILLLGVIWGLWHGPVIAMGHNYPGYPLLGILVMTLYTIGLGFFLGYAVLKSGSVWLAAYLHALNNAVASFLLMLVYRPDDPVFSFGVGLYGIVVWGAITAGLFLDRKVWATTPTQEIPDGVLSPLKKGW